MVAHVNFYENLKEANMRLRGTIVLYDGYPYYVHCITNHMTDGIFRVYCEPIGGPNGMSYNAPIDPVPSNVVPFDHPECGKAMDVWIEKYPQFGILRKHMNSPAFNKFRPFPLGMINMQGRTYYIERQPTRHTQQGFVINMASIYALGLHPEKCGTSGFRTDTEFFRDMIVGNYPTKAEVLEKLNDESVANDVIAFDRQCAITRGPVGSRFFIYKNEVVGFLPNGDFSCLKLDKKFAFLKEAIDNLFIFANPIIIA